MLIPCYFDALQTMDLACVETQMGNGDKTDCEIVQLDAKKGEIVTVRIL